MSQQQTANNVVTNYTDKRHKKLSKNNLNEFRKIVRKSLGELEHSEETVFYSLPEEVWANFFELNFGNDIEFARTNIFNMPENQKRGHRNSEKNDELMQYIDNFNIAVNLFETNFQNNKPIIILTDTDNDGSFAQSIAYNMRRALSHDENNLLYIEYARATEKNKTRGFTSELIEELFELYGFDNNQECLIVTADNGINSYSEQRKINALFPNATLLITDHHNPENGMCIQENENTYVFNPHYSLDKHCKKQNIIEQRKALNIQLANNKYKKEKKVKSDEFFNEYNISGATTLGLIVKEIIKNRTPDVKSLSLNEQMQYKEIIENNLSLIKKVDELSVISNMLDYVYTHPDHKPMDINTIKSSLELQSLLNTVNSMNNVIMNNIDNKVIDILLNKANNPISILSTEPFDINNVIKENQNAQSLNVMAHVILSDYFKYRRLSQDEKESFVKDYDKGIDTLNEKLSLLMDGKLSFDNFTFNSGNYNYIEQLRPIIFDLMVENNKSVYEKDVYEHMISIFKELKKCERNLMNELRKIDIMEQYESSNVSISVLDIDMQRIFNRKLLNKAYNKSNNGFTMILDNTNENTISGSFRSNFDISLIFNDKEKRALEKNLNVKIETPGHERAAGFIIRTNGEKFDSNRMDLVLNSITQVLDTNIEKVKTNNLNDNSINIISDLDSLSIISRINAATRGMVAHFYKITPLVKIDPYTTVSINNSTGEQFSLVKVANENKFGWTPLTVKLTNKEGNDGTVILMPNSALRELNNHNFDDYIRLNYMADGTYVFEKIIKDNEIDLSLNHVYFEKNNKGANEMIKFYEKQLQTGNYVEQLSNEDLQKLPFFQYNVNGEDAFRKYESYVIERLNQSNKSYSSTLDVEAAGFGNAPMFNIGFITYFIDPNSGIKITERKMRENSVQTYNDVFYTDSKANILNLIKNKQLLSIPDYLSMFKTNDYPYSQLVKYNGVEYIMNPNKLDGTPYLYKENVFNQNNEFIKVYNHNYNASGTHIVLNQQIVGENVAFLIKPDHYVIPTTLEKLTNIDNLMAAKYGKTISEVDDFLSQYFAEKQKNGTGILFEAHNTKYDARILNINLRKTSEFLYHPANIVSDSMEMAKNNRLFYFDSDIMTIKGIAGLQDIYFYSPENSRWGLKKMLADNSDEAQIYDITGQNLLIKRKNVVTRDYDFYLYNEKNNTTIQLDTNINTESMSKEKIDSINDVFGLDIDADNPPEIITISLNDLVAKATQDLFNRYEIVKQKTIGRGANKTVVESKEWVNKSDNLSIASFYQNLPFNKIKSNANGLGETLAIKNLMDWIVKDKTFKVNYLDVNKYKLKDINDVLINFMHEYRFEFSKKTNVENLLNNEDLYKGVAYRVTQLQTPIYDAFELKVRNEELERFVQDFVKANQHIASVYDNRWIYKSVLQHYQPKLLTDLNNANYENIAYQTAFPVEVVKEVLNNAYKYQQEFKHLGCEGVLLAEQHNNGVSFGNYAGDTVFEAVAVGLNAVDVLQTPNTAASISLGYADTFTMRLQGNRNSYENTAIDSMSFKQHSLYAMRDANDRTLLAEKFINKADNLLDNNQPYKVVNFKLNESTLDNGKEIYAVTKNGVSLDRETLDRDAKLLNRIMKIYQISFGKGDVGISSLYDSNLNELKAIKDELQSRYVYIEFNASKKYVDDYQKNVIDVLNYNLGSNHAIHFGLNVGNCLNQVLNSSVFNNKTNNNDFNDIIRAEHILGVEKIINYQIFRVLPSYLINNGVQRKDLNNDIKVFNDFLNNGSNDEPINFKFKSKVAFDLANAIHEIRQIKDYSNSELNQKFQIIDGRKISNEKIISIMEKHNVHQNTMQIAVGTLALNSGLVQYKKENPANIDLVVNYLNKNGETKFNDYWNSIKLMNATIFSNDFLDFSGSRIYRNSVVNYMFKHFSPIELGGKSIHDYYVSGNQPLKLFSNLELNNDFLNGFYLESQMELPTETIEIDVKVVDKPKIKNK